MALIWIGMLLVFGGMVLAATRTMKRGRLSEARSQTATKRPDTLEPSGRGSRLSIKADLPGLGLMALGALLLLIGAFV
ncbi:hypothetical protein [Sphingomonas cavernae]|uniref:Uncharacterized protein n=1 Tax=Sphingomonas cavernae TaxID=2320861 RepID=A0A418WNR0_9SPHN|nr:hypothetical protein [Sphingomonas cavernae]RJF92872.1 hypothetical protein D3876_00310 [Sphingomonas cavernae]